MRSGRYRPLLLDLPAKVLATPPRGLPHAAREEGPSRLREARARTSDPDLGSHRPRHSTPMDMGPSGRQRPVGELLSERVQPDTQAHSASVTDGRQLVTHPIANVQSPHDPADRALLALHTLIAVPASAARAPHQGRVEFVRRGYSRFLGSNSIQIPFGSFTKASFHPCSAPISFGRISTVTSLCWRAATVASTSSHS